MVVNGRYVAVGSQGRYIKHGLETIKRPHVDLSVTTDSAADAARTNLQITVDNSAGHDIPQDAYVWLAVFDERQLPRSQVVRTTVKHWSIIMWCVSLNLYKPVTGQAHYATVL